MNDARSSPPPLTCVIEVGLMCPRWSEDHREPQSHTVRLSKFSKSDNSKAQTALPAKHHIISANLGLSTPFSKKGADFFARASGPLKSGVSRLCLHAPIRGNALSKNRRAIGRIFNYTTRVASVKLRWMDRPVRYPWAHGSPRFAPNRGASDRVPPPGALAGQAGGFPTASGRWRAGRP